MEKTPCSNLDQGCLYSMSLALIPDPSSYPLFLVFVLILSSVKLLNNIYVIYLRIRWFTKEEVI